MVIMSAGIAILGLLQSSPAVIIGAMLISPLMGPIIGFGFALATLDWAEVRKGLGALALGALVAVFFSCIIVLLSPLRDVTSEILARTRPNLFDLMVAVFSALAGAYATVRGRGETIVGVAIATALMPPLAVVGFGLATSNMAIFGGALALFFTNFIAIALSATLVARFYGFGSGLSPAQSRWQGWALLLVFLLLAVPLGLSLRQIAWETWATRMARTEIAREFGSGTRISSLEPDFQAAIPAFRIALFTDTYRNKAATDLEARLTRRLGRPVSVGLNQILVNQHVDQAELSRARAAADRAASGQLEQADLAVRLALATGATPERILVDPATRRAIVQASGDRSLTDWQATEQQLSDAWPDWTINVVPPLGPLPGIAVPPGEPLQPQPADIAATVWAIRSWGMNGAVVTPQLLSGERHAAAIARAEAVATALRAAGLSADLAPPAPIDRTREREQGMEAMRRVTVTPKALPPPPAPPPKATPETGEG